MENKALIRRRILAGLCLAAPAFWNGSSRTAAAPARLRIVATTPDLGDVARRVGGELVDVQTLAKGTEDIHAVPQRPSFLPKLNRADAVVHLGLWAEDSFLPALLEVAANPRILPGKPGYIDCSRFVTPLDMPQAVTRAEGDIHPFGNPHYNIDPRNGPLIARAIAEALSEIDPAHAPDFRQNAELFSRELETKTKEWKEKTARLKGTKAVSFHRDMKYLAQFLGLELLGEIEPKPGISPTPKRLEEIVRTMKAAGAKLILHEVQYADAPSRWIAEQTGARIAGVATMGGAFPGSDTYVGMIDHNVNAVLEAVP